jgi:hypothetical protein
MPLIKTARSFTGELDQLPLRIQYQTFRKVPPPPNETDNDDLIRPDTLTVTHGEETSTFEGDEIRSIDSPLGTLITVRLSFLTDISTTTLSIVVPPVGAQPADGRVTLHSLAVRTLHRTGMAPDRLEGQLTEYTTVNLHGEMDDPQ